MFESILSQLKDNFSFIIPFYLDWWFVIIPALLSILAVDTWTNYSKNKWWANIDYVYLAVNVPTELEKSPKIMEQFLTSIFGMQSGGSWSDKFWKGRQQLYLSFELVGIGGVTRFIIRTPKQIRDFVEAQLYAEYPEAEIAEVEDYAQNFSWEQVQSGYEFFAAEIKLAKDDPIPIRTYLEFEDRVNQAMMDPVANISETLTELRPGENAWIQILAAPSSGEWYKPGLKLVDKLMKRKEKEAPKGLPKIPVVNELLTETTDILRRVASAPFGEVEAKKPAKKEAPIFEPYFISSPGERTALEAIERNMSKAGFRTKIRFLYMAPKEIARPDSVVNSLFGYFWQFGTQDLNGFMPSKRHWTKVDYFFPKLRVARRKKNLFLRYLSRDIVGGTSLFILTTEELATIFHFPSLVVKAPNLERIESKKAEPPANLPIV